MLEKLSTMYMEGVVSKNVEAPHRSGRNESRLKIKCVQRAKFPIVGFVKDPAGVSAFGMGYLHEGHKISFEVERGQGGKTSAVDLRQA
jgi:bifunctional non-homologous end joining protein LigD